MNENGQIILSTDANQEGKIVKNQPFFREGTKGAYVMPPFYDAPRATYSVIFSQPVQIQNGTRGVIAGRANLAVLSALMSNRVYLGETGEAYIRTQGVTNAIASQTDGVALYPNYKDVSVLGAYHWDPKLQIALIAEIEESEVLRASNRALGASVGLAMLTMLAAAAILISGSIVNPIAHLATSAENISAGNLDVNAEVQRRDEIGVLANAFNIMTNRLRGLINNLEGKVAERTRDLSVAAAVSRQITRELDMDILLPQLAEKTREGFGLYFVSVFLYDSQAQNLTLQAGIGVEGKRMKTAAKSFHITARPSLVAQSANP